ncbi:protein kinase [Streptomyces sp. NPDC059533]|uniref:protein kinase domain-containing protein n=1 Tax=unclassified Streptomyces TaxID=2593676 RepID=UPI0036B42389
MTNPPESPHPPHPPEPLEPLGPSDPPRVGPYTLLGRLGAGGMGAVYLGRSPGGRTVAVKLVRPELAADPGFRARFRAEVTAARAVSGAFTAPVVDADPDGPAPWMATAYVPGVPLGRAVALAGPLPRTALRALAAGIAEALESIHAAGLTHRDLKPGNVLLALDGPHVIDFGIARSVDGTVLTAAGTVLGTPGYMSPEQATAGRVGPASDVFSLGTTLAFAARGVGPFDGGRNVDVLERVVREEADLSAVPEDLRPLVAGCLSKDPADRPTPREVVEYVAGGAATPPVGAWLPPVLTAVIEAAAAVMAPEVAPSPAPPGPSLSPPLPSFPPGPPPQSPSGASGASGTSGTSGTADAPGTPSGPKSGPEDAEPGRPSRRALLFGVAGGAVALAGGGTGLGLWLTRDRSAGPGDAKKSGHGVTDPARPLGTDVTATPLWTAPVTEPLVQITGEGETVLALSAKNVWAVGRTGLPVWGPVALTSEGPLAGLATLVATVADGTAYTVVTGGASGRESVLRAIRLDTGADAWTLSLNPQQSSLVPAETAVGVSVLGMLGGKVYVTGTASYTTVNPSAEPSKRFDFRSGPTIWAVDPAERKVTWKVRLSDPDVKYSQGRAFLPSSGTRLMWVTANSDGSPAKIAGIETAGEGKVVWEQPSPGAGATTIDQMVHDARGRLNDGPHSSAGGYFLHMTDGLYAIDQANGQIGWRAPKTLFGTVVAAPDGKTVYAAGMGSPVAVAGMQAIEGLATIGIVVYAFDAATGAVRWAGNIEHQISGTLTLLSADDTVYLNSGGHLWALNAEDGKARWTYGLNPALTYGSVPVWAGAGRVYGAGTNGLVALGEK